MLIQASSTDTIHEWTGADVASELGNHGSRRQDKGKGRSAELGGRDAGLSTPGSWVSPCSNLDLIPLLVQEGTGPGGFCVFFHP